MSDLARIARDVLEHDRRSRDPELPPVARAQAKLALTRAVDELREARGPQTGDRVRVRDDVAGDVVLRVDDFVLVKLPADDVRLPLVEAVVAAGEILDSPDPDVIVDARARLFRAITATGYFRGHPDHVDAVVGNVVDDVLELLELRP